MEFALPWRDRLLIALSHVLHVRRSELDRTVRMAGLAVVLGCGMYTAFNATQATFLTNAGANAYPLFFVILALSVWPAIALNQATSRRWGVARAFRYNMLANAIVPVFVFAGYRIALNGPISFACYVVYSVAFELVMLAFWAFVSQYFNLLEAKRIFPVIAAGSGLGYIFAGAVTSLGARGPLGTPGLCFVWAAGAAAAGLIAYRSERRLFRPPVEEDADELVAEHHAVAHRRGLLAEVREAVSYVVASRLVAALVLLATVLIVAMRISDYVVAKIFVAATHNVTELTILIGNAWEISYVIQLALGLWITPWLLAKAGVKNAILTLPILTLFGFLAVALFPSLAASLLLFVVRNGIQTGVDDPAENVLSGALPGQVAPKLKVLLDNLVLPGAAAIAGLGLLVIEFAFRLANDVFLALVGASVTIGLVAAALWVRSLYVSAIYERLHAHTLSLSDLELALGKPSPAELAELKTFIGSDSDDVREFAAAALGRLAPEAFLELAPELAVSDDARLRRLAFQMPAPGALPRGLIEAAAADRDPWVVAAAAVAGNNLKPPWQESQTLLDRLYGSDDAEAKAASVWAAAFIGDHHQVAESLTDQRPRVRLEAIKSFAKLKANVAGAADPLMNCLRDDDPAVRREALRQAIRWAPPAGTLDEFANVLVANLTASDPLSRRLAGEAIAAQCPQALEHAIGLLEADTGSAVATIEALVRSGRPQFVARAMSHVEEILDTALDSAELSGRLRALRLLAGPDQEDFRFAVLRIALEDYVRHVVEMTLAALRTLHEKRGFARVERGLRSAEPEARVEAVETLLNFGPARLVDPLTRLLEPENFEATPARPLSEADLALLERHPDQWVRRAAEAVSKPGPESMKELIALKKVPLFANLTLEQLASIDRLMVTRRYLPGETIFRYGDLSSELYVILEGEVRIHRDGDGSEVTLARLGASSVMGEMAPFTEQPRSASAQALVPTTCRVLRKDRLNAILHEHPEVLLEVIRNLSQRLVVANEQLEAAARHSHEQVPSQPRPPRRRKAATTAPAS